MSLEESRNPLAKGLLSIFNLVIWKHRKERRNMNIVLRYCSVQSMNQSILLTSLLILSVLLGRVLQSWGGKPGCITRMAMASPKGTVGSVFMLPSTGGTHPRTTLLLPNPLTPWSRLSFPRATPYWHLSIVRVAAHPLIPAQTRSPEDVTSSAQPHFFFCWDADVLSQTYQPSHTGSLTVFAWKEIEDWKEGWKNVGRTRMQTDRAWVKGVTSLKPLQSGKTRDLTTKTLLQTCPVHPVRLSVLPKQPTDQESLWPKASRLPLTLQWNFTGRAGGFPCGFWGAGEKILHGSCDIFQLSSQMRLGE